MPLVYGIEYIVTNSVFCKMYLKEKKGQYLSSYKTKAYFLELNGSQKPHQLPHHSFSRFVLNNIMA